MCTFLLATLSFTESGTA